MEYPAEKGNAYSSSSAMVDGVVTSDEWLPFFPLLPPAQTSLYSMVPAFAALVSSTFTRKSMTSLRGETMTPTMTRTCSQEKEKPQELSAHDNRNREVVRSSTSARNTAVDGAMMSESMPLAVLQCGGMEMQRSVFSLSSLHRLLQEHAKELSAECKRILSTTPALSSVNPSRVKTKENTHNGFSHHAQDGNVHEKEESSDLITREKKEKDKEHGGNTLKGRGKPVWLPSSYVVLQAVQHLQRTLRRRPSLVRGGRKTSCHTPPHTMRSSLTSEATTMANGNNAENDIPGKEEDEAERRYLLPEYELRHTDALEVLSLLQFLSWYCLESTVIQLEASMREDVGSSVEEDAGGSKGVGITGAIRSHGAGTSALPSSSSSSPFFFSSPVTSSTSSSLPQRFSSSLGRRPVLPDDFLSPSIANIRKRQPRRSTSTSMTPSVPPSSSFRKNKDTEKDDNRFGGLWYRVPRDHSASSSGRSSTSRMSQGEMSGGTGESKGTGMEGVKRHQDPVGSTGVVPPSPLSTTSSIGSSCSSFSSHTGGVSNTTDVGAANASHETKEGKAEADEDDEDSDVEEDDAARGKREAQCAERLFSLLLGEELLTHLGKATADRATHHAWDRNTMAPHQKEEGSREDGEKTLVASTSSHLEERKRRKPLGQHEEVGKRVLLEEWVDNSILPTATSCTSLLVSLHFYALVLLAVALLRYEPVANGIYLSRLFSPVDPAHVFLSALPSSLDSRMHTFHDAPSSSSSSSAPFVVASQKSESSKEEKEKKKDASLIVGSPLAISPLHLPYGTPRHSLLFPFLYSTYPAIRWAAGLTLQHLMQYLSCFHIAEEPLPPRRSGPRAGNSNKETNYGRGGGSHLSNAFTSLSSHASSSFVPLSVHSGTLLHQLHALACWLLSASEPLSKTPSSPWPSSSAGVVSHPSTPTHTAKLGKQTLDSAAPRYYLATEAISLLEASTRPLLFQLLVTLVTITPYRRCPSCLERVQLMLSLLGMGKRRREWRIHRCLRHDTQKERLVEMKVEREQDVEKNTETAQNGEGNTKGREDMDKAQGVVAARSSSSPFTLLDVSGDSLYFPCSPLTTSMTITSKKTAALLLEHLGDTMSRHGAVAFITQCICRLHPLSSASSSLTEGERKGIRPNASGGEGGVAAGPRAIDIKGTLDIRQILSYSKQEHVSSSFLQTPKKAGVPSHLGLEKTGKQGHPPQRQPKGEEGKLEDCLLHPFTPTTFSNAKVAHHTLCDALLGVPSTCLQPATLSSSPLPCASPSSKRNRRRRKHHGSKEEEAEGNTREVEEEVRCVFSSVDWLCVTSLARFFPDLIEASPVRLGTLIQQTLYTFERFIFYHSSGTFSHTEHRVMKVKTKMLCGSKEGTTQEGGWRTDPSTSPCACTPHPVARALACTTPLSMMASPSSPTAAAAVTALAEALRSWVHFIGYVWVSFDGKYEDVALQQHQHYRQQQQQEPSAASSPASSPPSSSSSSFPPRVSALTKYMVCRHVFFPIWKFLLHYYEERREGEDGPHLREETKEEEIREEGDANWNKSRKGEPNSTPSSTVSLHSTFLRSSLPPAPVVKMALRAAANISEECVALLRASSNEEHVPSPASHTTITNRKSMKTETQDEEDHKSQRGVEAVMVAFVRHCAELDSRAIVRVEALQTIGIWCWSYPSLDEMLLRTGVYGIVFHSLRTEKDANCGIKAAWALSNLCVRLAETSTREEARQVQGGKKEEACRIVSTSSRKEKKKEAVLPREGDPHGIEKEIDASSVHSAPFSLRDEPVVIEWLSEAALCATSVRLGACEKKEAPLPSPYCLRHSFSSSVASQSALQATMLNHGIRIVRGLLQILTVNECLQDAVKSTIWCVKKQRGNATWRGHEKNDKEWDQKDENIDVVVQEDEVIDEVLIEAFLSRLSHLLSSCKEVKIRWNAAMALGVAVSRQDIFEAEPVGASAAIRLLCDVLQRDAFFKVRIRVVEALSKVCKAGLQGAYSDDGDFTPTVIQALCVALQKCQLDASSSTPSMEGLHLRTSSSPFMNGTQMGTSVGRSGSFHKAREQEAPLCPLHTTEANSSMNSFSTKNSSTLRSPALVSAIEQGKEELHQMIVLTIERILRTANPSIALDRVLMSNTELLQHEKVL